MDDYDLGKISSYDFREKFKSLLSIKNISDEDFDNTWNALILPICKLGIEKLKFVNDLKNKNEYNIFLLTNINEINLNEINKKCKSIGIDNLSDVFHKAYYSYEIHHKKPDIKSFNLILKEQNLNPNEVLFLDDSEENIKSSKKLGIIGQKVDFDTDLKKVI
jgi:putative hydrolase of the HAD superfamily